MGRRLAVAAVANRVRAARVERGWSQQELASRIGLTRQAISAIESGSYVPNTIVGLRLAQVLHCRVEDLFRVPPPTHGASVAIASPLPEEASRLAVANVGGKWVAHPLTDSRALHAGFLSADALAGEGVSPQQAQLLRPLEELEKSALLFGCDPGLSILEAHASRYPDSGRLINLFGSSRSALDAVAQGEAHIAGTHLHDAGGDTYNLGAAEQVLAGTGGLLVAFAKWELGLVVASGNPRHLRGVEDLARRGIRLANREPGSGSRALLDEQIAKAGLSTASIFGYHQVVTSHMAAGLAVASGGADAAVALRATAAALGLDFVPLAEVSFDLIIPEPYVEHPSVALMLEVLQSGALRADLAAMSGYDVGAMGSVVAEIAPNPVAA
jgi:molybdate-binding protein/DNA-binding XRE family transcriptional regulator